MKTTFFICLTFLGLAGFRNHMGRTISGTVYSAEDKRPLPGVSVSITGTSIATHTDKNGRYSIIVNDNHHQLTFTMIGYDTQQVKLSKKATMDIWMNASAAKLEEVLHADREAFKMASPLIASATLAGRVNGVMIRGRSYLPNTESYKGFTDNGFINPLNEALSTLAVDVDGASYSNVRRFLQNGQLPPADAVRIEEMINYFQYQLPSPTNGDPVAIHTELATAPWNPKHQLLRIGLKAKSVPTDKLPPSNLVFLIDVSGSMNGHNRLPLVKTSLKVLVDQLRENDNVAIVTYAGEAGIALESTSGKQKGKIKDAIDALEASGATAGGAGIQLAYSIAKQNFIKGGNNRIILASDGDFNVGPSSDEDMERLISKERQSGISLSVFGFGMGNLKDSKMETLANKGHGNYAYIDNISEARKAVVTEFGGTLFTVAKDVKLQIEFNPAKVQAYRLLGYENRLLEKEDFNNDNKLGGDMGVGHTVTALYEIIPVGVKDSYVGNVDPLKYQQVPTQPTVGNSNEIATVKFRFKDPDSEKSKMKQTIVSSKPILLADASDDFRFATAVAELGMLLRDSEYKQQASFDKLISRAKQAKGTDDEGYRAEFIRLAENAKMLQ
ncbi:YfbK domain-containing protein [Olivibacter sitiensis]|uniref:YfbK domain-containing protein n=1 Tax=Olivibacter sitiensis TaxID=376470 RepID=UPI00042215F8|nr:von Willebrand factor type A domain-containing protein [Olivibacter sitiensis]